MEKQENLKCNNFNILRFMAALMVMIGHMAFIDGSNNRPMAWEEGIHVLGVKIFFLIGGYLIAKSWLSDPHPMHYGIKRVFRIFPPLIMYTILVVFVFGPILSRLSIKEYFANLQTYRYLLNIVMFPIYSLPGVFENNPYPNAVNGSLWTLPIEIVMYIFVPIILRICRRKDQISLKIYSMITFCVCLFEIVHLWKFPSWRLVIWGTDLAQAFSLIPYYFLGMLFTFEEIKKYLNLQKAIVLAFAFFCISPYLTIQVNELVMYFVFPFLVFSFALAPFPCFGSLMRKCEISYGIYLWGFFIQQLVFYLLANLNVYITTMGYFIMSLLFTGVLAILSYKYIEMPFLKITKKLLQKI